MRHCNIGKWIGALATTMLLGIATAHAAPTVSLTAPANNAAFAEPATITLSANASIDDLTDLLLDISKVEFYRDGVLIGTDTTAPYSVVWNAVAAGNYVLTAKAYDTLISSATSAPVNIAVIAPPVVNIATPANNTVFGAQSSINISANASSNRGQSIAKVEFYQGGSLVGSSTSVPYTLTLPNNPPGTYTFTAKATDTVGGMTTSAAINIRVAAPPSVSIATPANNAVVVAPASFNLSANVAADSGLSIAKVDYYQGTTLIGTNTTAPYSFTWNNVASGSYSVTAIATDNLGGITTSTPITVISNIAPTVSITAPASSLALAAPANFNLAADATDSDGTIAKVDFYDGTSLIGTATNAPYSYSWTNVSDGIHSVTAVATDNWGTTSTSAAISLIAVTPPTVSITAPVNGTIVTAPASFNLSANAQASATGGAITKVEFYQNNQLLGTATNAPYTYNWGNVAAGSYSITAKAYDSYGITAISAAVTLISNTAPTVSFTAPTNNATYIAPATITLSANAADSVGTVTQVEFYQGNTLLATVTATPYTYDWNATQPGNYSLTAKATDNHGATTISTTVNITVNANQAPSISLTAPAPNANYTTPANIQLVANATDADGSIAQVAFYDGTTLLGTSTASPYTFNWNNVAIGSYTLSAIATDNLGLNTASAQLQITVAAHVAQIYYIHTDKLDTPRLITNQSNTPVWRWDSNDPFANNPVNDDPNSTGNHFVYNPRFPGQYFDKETNTHYNYFRDYDPQTGRYIESDPIGLEGGINTYGYVGGNPISRIDSNGKLWEALIPGILLGGGLYILQDCLEKCIDRELAEDSECTRGKATGTCTQRCIPFIELILSPTSTDDAAAAAAQAAGSAAGEALNK